MMPAPKPKQTYFKTIMLGLDDNVCALLLNRNDLSISAACGLVLHGFDDPLQLHDWQRTLLSAVGRALNYFFPRHCEGAVANDLARAKSTIAQLSSAATYFEAKNLI